MVALVAVSCTNEPEGSLIGKAKVTYTVDGPSQIATKAMGTISSAYTLYYEVRLWDGSALGDKLTGEGLSGSKTVAADKWPTTVTFDLARGKQYKILFWAQSTTAPEGLFNASNLTDIVIDYTKMAANNEECDAFSGSDVITPAGAMAASATLTRPFALVNLGTSDATQFKTASGNCTVGDVKVTVTGTLASSFNVATGEAGTGSATSFAPNAAPIDPFDAKTLIVNETAFNYLSAVYVLPAAGSEVIEVAYIIKDNNNADITTLEVTNVPVKTNYRTNITGKLLTGTTTYNISVDQAFTGDTDKVVGPTFANVDDLNDYFETLADNSDNGDIDPEEVTLTAINNGETIVLPAISGNVVIRIPATLDPTEGDGTLNIAYASSGDKPANLSLYVTQLKKLVANITSTHFTLLSGSHITDQADVHTNTTTFVIEKGAKVGTVKILQGNANIAGEVAKVDIPAGASADGDGAPVQVFLTKESAVEKIFLNAKTDVVVEQPKDQIEVEETEKKVAVYVNDGADNSTAKAQNGGVIYVEANVPCTVTADGTSEASSTVIIEPNAAGSAVVASNGGAIDLTANGNCAVVSEGSSTDPTTSATTNSTVTISDVATDENTGQPTVEIAASTSGTGQIIAETGSAEKAALVTDVAKIGDVKYASLAAAFDAAHTIGGNVTITMINNVRFSFEVEGSKNYYVNVAAGEDFTLNLNGFDVISANADSKANCLIENRGKLTITDSATSKGSLQYGASAAWVYDPSMGNNYNGSYVSNIITNKGTGEVVLENCVIKQLSSGSAAYIVDNFENSKLTINSGTFDATKTAFRLFYGNVRVTINGGTINAGRHNVGVFSGATTTSRLEIYGGTFNNTMAQEDNTAIDIWGETEATKTAKTSVKIAGGVFKAPVVIEDYYPGYNVEILGGTFKSIQAVNTPEIAALKYPKCVKGGTFEVNPKNGQEDYVDVWCMVEPANGGYRVVPAPSWDEYAASDSDYASCVDEGNKLVTISTAAQLAKFAKTVNEAPHNRYEGYTVELAADIDLDLYLWVPIGIPAYTNNFRGTFDGKGHKVSNLKVWHNENAGFFGALHGATIKNLVIDGFVLRSNHYAGAIVAWGESSAIKNVIDNCTAKNGTVTSAPEWVDGFDNGDKAGGIIGFCYDGTLTNNTVDNVTVRAYRDLAGLAGYAEKSVVTGNTVQNVRIKQDGRNAYKSSVTTYEPLLGRRAGSNTESDNTLTNCEASPVTAEESIAVYPYYNYTAYTVIAVGPGSAASIIDDGEDL